MDSWRECPHCHLKHRERPDGRCPRCREAVESDASADLNAQVKGSGDVMTGPPTNELSSGGVDGLHQSDGNEIPAGGTEEEFPIGWRVGGIILLVNALLGLAEVGLARDGTGTTFVGSWVVDAVLGGMLIAGKNSVRVFAVLRAVLGAVVFSIYLLVTGDPVMVVLQLAVSSALLLCLVGRPEKVRIAVGSVLASAYFMLSVLGLAALMGGANPAAETLWALRGELEGEELSGKIGGDATSYSIEVPEGTGWYHRDSKKRIRDNNMADMWLVRPDVDAHVLVIVEIVDGEGEVLLESLVDVVMANLKAGAQEVEVIGSRLIPGDPSGRLVEVEATVEGLSLRYWYGIYADGDWAVQVITFTSQTNSAAIGSNLEDIATSFRWE